MTEHDEEAGEVERQTAPSPRRTRLRRLGRGMGKAANWFVPIAATRDTTASTKQSLIRISGSFRLLWVMIQASWARAKAAQQAPDAAALSEATASLSAMPEPVRAAVKRGARAMWAFGVAMMVMGVVLFALTISSMSFGWIATTVYAMASLGWAGFGVGYALRSASDYHAVDQRRLCTGWTVLRTPALWVPLPMDNSR